MNEIFQCKFGAHLYGLETPESDTDIKGVFIPTREEIVLGRALQHVQYSTGDNESKNTRSDIDYEMISLQYFCERLASGDHVAIDMIHTPKDRSEVTSEVWDYLRANRGKFYTKKMISAAIDYINQNASKYGLVGSRSHTLANIYAELKSWMNSDPNATIGYLVESNSFGSAIVPDLTGNEVYIGSSRYPKNMKIRQIFPLIEVKYRQVCERYIKAQNNEGINWKDVSHAMRYAHQMIEILYTGDLKYPFTGIYKDTLMRVKLGQVSWKECQCAIEELRECLQTALDTIDLPEEADQAWIDHFVYCRYYRAIQPDFWS